jgi:mediator of RNA polymerase II transcription subunit 18
MIKGVKFYYGSISLEIFQIFIKKDGEVVNLDENLYILRCFINVEKSTDVENLTNGSQELMNLKAELAGLVELETPDRNLMDSRIGIRK